jgi:folate-binding protein YgfZ
MADASYVLLEDRAILAVGGPDRRAFLQGLISNDVDKVAPARAGYAALLTAQGRYLHDFMIAEDGGALLLDAERERIGDLKRRLAVYRLRSKVTLDERPEVVVAAVFGAAALVSLDLPAEPGAARAFAGGLAFVDPRLSALGARCFLGRDGAAAVLAAAGCTAAPFADYDRLRLCLGVPDGSRDLVPEKSLLLESGFDELHGVDWNKGCYIGQELTARTKYRGLVKRRLIPVLIEGPVPAPGTLTTIDGREAGEMRSSRDGRGLALLRIDAALDQRPLSAGESVIRPETPEWMRLADQA